MSLDNIEKALEALEYYADDDNYEPFNTLGGERPAPALKMKGKLLPHFYRGSFKLDITELQE